jgi:hypothetical protein
MSQKNKLFTNSVKQLYNSPIEWLSTKSYYGKSEI